MKLLSELFPNGITHDARRKLHDEIIARGKRSERGWMQLSGEDKVLDEELDAVEMMESLFAYGQDVHEYFIVNCHSNGMGGYLDKAPGYIERYAKNIAKVGVVSLEEAKAELTKVCENQIKLFSKAAIKYNVFTDSEGCSYNSIEYPEGD